MGIIKNYCVFYAREFPSWAALHEHLSFPLPCAEAHGAAPIVPIHRDATQFLLPLGEHGAHSPLALQPGSTSRHCLVPDPTPQAHPHGGGTAQCVPPLSEVPDIKSLLYFPLSSQRTTALSQH